jgi:isoquinoline 1-oxidoreductase beta subunit
MPRVSPPSRRCFLVGATLTVADLLVPIIVAPIRAAEGSGADPINITDWIKIAANGDITLGLSQPEVGQGSYTILPAILAEELDADWQRVAVRFVTGKAAYQIAFNREAPVQKEGASMSTTVLYGRLRQAGAAARDALIRAAAQRWGIGREECRTEKSFVISARGERLSYGELVAAAAELALDPDPPLKDPARFELIGKPVARLDTPAKCDGRAIFGIDVTVPGMLNGAIRMAPAFGGAVVAIRNEADVAAMPGVRAIVKIPGVAVANEEPGSQHPGIRQQPRAEAVCVIAAHFWQARRAIEALDVEFDRGDGGDLSSAKIDAAIESGFAAERGVTALLRGDPQSLLQQAGAGVIERRYVLPHIAHAPMEPVNATAHYQDGQVEVWGSIQSVSPCQDAVAAAVGCAADAVKVNVTFLGGSFGRKIVPDFAVQAVHASKAVGKPVKLVRSREEDMRHDTYRPNAGGYLRAVLDADGYPLAVHARVVGQSLFGATRKSWLDHTPEGDWDESMVDGIYNQSYRLPNFLVETIDTPQPIPVYFMRSVGSTAGVFFWESFISALARQAGIDQYRYRHNLLADDPLARRVLEAAAEAANWTSPPPAGIYRGIAYNCYIGRGGRFKTYVAEVVELERRDRRLALRRVFCAVDPGLVVNPNTLTAQIEGGIGFGLTTALKSKITFANGGAVETNFTDYPLISIGEMPEVVPIIVASDRPPQGFGEVVLAPLAPAIAQALLLATGREITTMPLPDDAFRLS